MAAARATTVHTLLVDSRDRNFAEYPTPNEYKLRLPMTYYNVVGARLASAEIPRSFHTLSASHGNTSFDIVVAGAAQPVTVVLEDGNYTFMSLKVGLESALDVATGLAWTVMFSSTTNRVTLVNSQMTEFVIDSPDAQQPTDYGLLYYLGFDRGQTFTSSSARLTSPRPASFHGVSYILLDIEELRGAAEGMLYGGGAGQRPLAKIAMDPGAQGITMLDTSKCAFDAHPQKPMIPRLKELRVRFRYHDGRAVDFNGIDHSFVLSIETRDPEMKYTSAAAPLVAAAPAALRRPAPPQRVQQLQPQRQPPRVGVSRDRPLLPKKVVVPAVILFLMGGAWYWKTR